jgi:hypothetical protein
VLWLRALPRQLTLLLGEQLLSSIFLYLEPPINALGVCFVAFARQAGVFGWIEYDMLCRIELGYATGASGS